MKQFLSIIFAFLLVFSFSCGSDKPDKLPSSNQKRTSDKEASDTTETEYVEYKGLPINADSAEIILTGGTEKDRQYVFIDKRKKSTYYDRITNVELSSKFETTQYRDSYMAILKNHTENYQSDKIENISLPKNWIELKFYESDYYVYCPAREEENLKIKITDTTLMIFKNIGVVAEKISGYEKIDNKHSLINTACLTDNVSVFY